jgi:hypothetical protein
MLTAIEFDGQCEFRTVKVQHVGRYRMLAAELASGEPPVPKQMPHEPLGIRGVVAEFTGKLAQFMRDVIALTPSPSPACGRGVR